MRGDGVETLISSLVALISDGVRKGKDVWNVIKTVTASGPATKAGYFIATNTWGSKKKHTGKFGFDFLHLICLNECFGEQTRKHGSRRDSNPHGKKFPSGGTSFFPHSVGQAGDKA